MATKAKKKPAAKAKPAAAAKNKKAVKVKPVKKAVKPAKKPVAKAAPKKAKPVAKAKKPVKKVASKPVAKTAKVAKQVTPKPIKQVKVVAKPKPEATVANKDAGKKQPKQRGRIMAPQNSHVKILTPGKTAKDLIQPSSAAIKHVEKHNERPRRRSRASNAFIKPTPPPRTTPLRVDPILPDTPVMSSLKKPVAILTNTPSKLENAPEKKRYSDEELKEFRALIVNKLSDAKTELNNLQAFLNNTNEHGTDDTASSFKMLEDGSDTLAKEEAGQLAARQRKFIEQLENALVRIDNKSYGICRVTGKLIPKERLRAVPHTTQSIEAKVQQYRD
jgi:RNA polymerase-binding transcription factor DksA